MRRILSVLLLLAVALVLHVAVAGADGPVLAFTEESSEFADCSFLIFADDPDAGLEHNGWLGNVQIADYETLRGALVGDPVWSVNYDDTDGLGIASYPDAGNGLCGLVVNTLPESAGSVQVTVTCEWSGQSAVQVISLHFEVADDLPAVTNFPEDTVYLGVAEDWNYSFEMSPADFTEDRRNRIDFRPTEEGYNCQNWCEGHTLHAFFYEPGEYTVDIGVSSDNVELYRTVTFEVHEPESLSFCEDGRENIKFVHSWDDASFWVDDYVMPLNLVDETYYLWVTDTEHPDYTWVQTDGPETELDFRITEDGPVLFLAGMPEEPCDLAYTVTAQIGEYSAEGSFTVRFCACELPETLGFDRCYTLNLDQTITLEADFGGDEWAFGNTWRSIVPDEEDSTGTIACWNDWILDAEDNVIGMKLNVTGLQPGVVSLPVVAAEDGLAWGGLIHFIVLNDDETLPELPPLGFSEADTNRQNRKPVFSGNDPAYSVDDTVMDLEIENLDFYRNYLGEDELVTWVQTGGPDMDLAITEDGYLGIVGTQSQPCTLTYEITVSIGDYSISTNMGCEFFACAMPEDCGLQSVYTLHEGDVLELHANFAGADWQDSAFRGVFAMDYDFDESVVTAELKESADGWEFYMVITAEGPGYVGIPMRVNQDGMNWDGVVRFVVLNKDGTEPELPPLSFYEDGRENVKFVRSWSDDSFWVDDYMMDLGLENQEYYCRLIKTDRPEYSWEQTGGPAMALSVRDDGEDGCSLLLAEMPDEPCDLVYTVTAQIGEYSATATVTASFRPCPLPETLGFDRCYTLNVGQTITLEADFGGDDWTFGNTWKSLVPDAEDSTGTIETQINYVFENGDEEGSMIGMSMSVTGLQPGTVTLPVIASEDGLAWGGSISFIVRDENGDDPELPPLGFSAQDTNRQNRKPVFSGNDPAYSVDETVMDLEIENLDFYRNYLGVDEQVTWVQTGGPDMDLAIMEDGQLGIVGTQSQPCTLTYVVTVSIGDYSISTNMSCEFFACAMPTNSGLQSSYTLSKGDVLELHAAFAGDDWQNSEFRGVFAMDYDFDESVVTAELRMSNDGWEYYMIITAEGPGYVSIPMRVNQDGMNWDGMVRFVVLNEDETLPDIPPAARILNLPGSLLRIEEEALAGTDAERININTGCLSIGSRAFADSDALTQLYIPDTVTSIADDMLDGCRRFQVIITTTGSDAAAWGTSHGYTVITE